MMKRYYEHKYSKVVVPFTVLISDLGDYLTDYAYEVVSNMLDSVSFSVTIEDEPGDPDTGERGGYRIDDWDIQPLGENLVLFRDAITNAVGDYVWDHEEDILSSKKVSAAFAYFFSMKEAG